MYSILITIFLLAWSGIAICMNILFLTIFEIDSISERGIYQDLLREFIKHGHMVSIVCPAERRYGKRTRLYESTSSQILKVRTLNLTKTHWFEKGFATVLLEHQYKSAIKKYFYNLKFDVVIYSTPPVTLTKVIKYIKKRDNAVSYLLLKDIFPQNAVDLGILSPRSPVYFFFKHKERMLYRISNNIGCMSQANVEYLLKHNKQLDICRVHICPNSITPSMLDKMIGNRADIRNKYNIPIHSKVFINGGNLGKPQCVPFIVECLRLNQNKDDRYFLICGSGVDANILQEYIKIEAPANVKMINLLPEDKYAEILSACDVGLIFLDHRFTIPNFPSRLLAYMEKSLPVLACTDPNTDIGKIIEDGTFGWWSESDDPEKFSNLIDKICGQDTTPLGLCGRRYLEKNFLAVQSAKIIMDCITTS